MGIPWYRQISRGQWLALTAALLGWMFDGFEMGIFPLVARPALIDVLGLGEDARLAGATSDPQVQEEAKKRVDTQVGLWNGRITAAFLLGAACGGWAFGWLGDRIGRVRAMVFSVVTYAAFTGLCGLAMGPWQLAILRYLSALGMGGEWALGVALVMESWPGQARPVLAGLIGAIGNVGYILTALLVMAVKGLGTDVAAGGWRWVLGACALPALLTFFIRMFVPESEKWQEAVKSGPRARLIDIFAPGLWKRTLIGALLGGIALVGTWGSVQWIPQWVNQLSGGNQSMSNYAQMAAGLGAVIGSFLGAALGIRIARRVAYLVLCTGSLVTCAFLFRYLGGQTEVDALFLTAIALVGGFTAAFYGWLPLYLPELFPTRLRATGQGFCFNSGRILAAVAAVSTGVLMSDVFHGSYAQAGATISLVYIAGLLVIWFAPETRGQALPE